MIRTALQIFIRIPLATYVFVKTLVTGLLFGTCADCGSFLVEGNDSFYCPKCDRATKTGVDEL